MMAREYKPKANAVDTHNHCVYMFQSTSEEEVVDAEVSASTICTDTCSRGVGYKNQLY